MEFVIEVVAALGVALAALQTYWVWSRTRRRAARLMRGIQVAAR